MFNKAYYKHKYGLDLDDRRLEWCLSEESKLIIDYLGNRTILSHVELGKENFNELFQYLLHRNI
jgi:hypothetical protein